MKRVRVIAYVVTPQVVVDDTDDDSLTAVEIQPVAIPANNWPNVPPVFLGIEQVKAALAERETTT